MSRLLRCVPAAVAALALAAVLAGCTEDLAPGVDPAQVDAVEAPELGACRVLTLDDIAQPSNATKVVDCTDPHTAMTYAVGSLPEELEDVAYDADELGAFVFERCTTKFAKLLGADESLAMRTVLTWAWFRPSENAWDEGARWYRCDVVGGGEQSKEYVDLPETAKGLLLGRPDDKWLVCAQGPTVAGSVKVPCAQKHNWRAVTTIKVGLDNETYPGDRQVEVITREYCSDSVGAWMNYPIDYDYAYTWFHRAEWEAGNRRSICWAKTPR